MKGITFTFFQDEKINEGKVKESEIKEIIEKSKKEKDEALETYKQEMEVNFQIIMTF